MGRIRCLGFNTLGAACIHLDQSKKEGACGSRYLSTIVGAAITASIQWNQTYDAHWSVLGFWYGALLLSLFSVVICFHLGIYLSSIPLRAPDRSYRFAIAGNTKFGQYANLWVLQTPTQLLSYSIISYVLGLSVMIISKLWDGPWSNDSKIALLYIGYFILGFSIYISTAVWIYRSDLY
ncbi:uncharacterized protein DFL_001299 [Arthrobotrys flagrans]|uniref:Uncharacterized protein n=1 Tax=Arthrobotrys flagrans TaxID=97331 RepID=A0A437AGR2_ARTFL|nr:hypothetical protein DFL_001299 [Arthrobotrys flagrans]